MRSAGKGVEMTFIKAMLIWLSLCPIFYKRKRFTATTPEQRNYDWTPYVEGVHNVAVDPRILEEYEQGDLRMVGGTD